MKNKLEKDIKTLNELYHDCLKSSSELQNAYVEWDRRRNKNSHIAALQKKCASAGRAFDDFLKRLNVALKFDIEKGEYFPAKDSDGKESYRIKVTRTRSVTLTVSAESREAALSAAKGMVEADGKSAASFGREKISYEEISR